MTNVLSDNNARIPDFGKCSPLWLYSNTVDQCMLAILVQLVQQQLRLVGLMASKIA